MLRVGIAVAGDLLRDSVSSCLQDSQVMETYAARTVQEVIRLLQEQRLDALILDDQFDQETWIGSLVSSLKQAAPDVAILLVGSFADGAFIYEMFEAGSEGYLFRGDDLAPVFAPSIEAVCAHQPYLSPTAMSQYAQTVHSGRGRQWLRLDEQAKQVLRLPAGGTSVRGVAHALDLKDSQVYWIRSKLRQRFHATTNEELILRAGLQGYLKHAKELG